MRRAHLRAIVFSTVTAICVSFGASGQIQPQDGPSCGTYPKCNELGTAALRQGRTDEAITLFEQQAALAELADIERQTKSRDVLLHSPCKLALTAYNNLAVAYSDKHDYLQARAWSLVALRCDEKSQAAQFNLHSIERALVGWQWPQTPAGEYLQYAGRGTWESFVVEPSPDKVHFCFSGLWWGLGEGPSGLGDLTATVPLRDSQAEYTSLEFTNNKCAISMHFSPDKLEVKQTGSDFDCGFGHNVTANGTFQRISTSAKCREEVK
jgi:hypothetical protein